MSHRWWDREADIRRESSADGKNLSFLAVGWSVMWDKTRLAA
ncbi:hypothetical protein [Curvibacter gracilis]|nr:hypothetical protein [Curvibacter gracilis]